MNRVYEEKVWERRFHARKKALSIVTTIKTIDQRVEMVDQLSSFVIVLVVLFFFGCFILFWLFYSCRT